MLGEDLTIERIDRELEALDRSPWLENAKHAATRGDWLLARQSLTGKRVEVIKSVAERQPSEEYTLEPGAVVTPEENGISDINSGL